MSALVNGISPNTGTYGISITVRGERFGYNSKDIEKVEICDIDVTSTVIWHSPTKLICRNLVVALFDIEGTIIITTASGGRGKCDVSFVARATNDITDIETESWMEEDFDVRLGRSEVPVIRSTQEFDLLGIYVPFTRTDISPKCSIRSSDFDSDEYLSQIHANTSWNSLIQGQAYLLGGFNSKVNSDFTYLKSHIHQIIKCHTALKEVHDDSITKNNHTQLERAISTLSSYHSQTFVGVLERMSTSDKVRKAILILNQQKHIVDFPKRLKSLADNQMYVDMVKLYITRKKEFSSSAGSVLIDIISKECDALMSSTATNDIKRLCLVFPQTISKRRSFLQLLSELKMEDDVAFDAIAYAFQFITDKLDEINALIKSSSHAKVQDNHDFSLLSRCFFTYFLPFWDQCADYTSERCYPMKHSISMKSPGFIVDLQEKLFQHFNTTLSLMLAHDHSAFDLDEQLTRFRFLTSLLAQTGNRQDFYVESNASDESSITLQNLLVNMIDNCRVRIATETLQIPLTLNSWELGIYSNGCYLKQISSLKDQLQKFADVLQELFVDNQSFKQALLSFNLSSLFLKLLQQFIDSVKAMAEESSPKSNVSDLTVIRDLANSRHRLVLVTTLYQVSQIWSAVLNQIESSIDSLHDTECKVVQMFLSQINGCQDSLIQSFIQEQSKLLSDALIQKLRQCSSSSSSIRSWFRHFVQSIVFLHAELVNLCALHIPAVLNGVLNNVLCNLFNKDLPSMTSTELQLVYEIFDRFLSKKLSSEIEAKLSPLTSADRQVVLSFIDSQKVFLQPFESRRRGGTRSKGSLLQI